MTVEALTVATWNIRGCLGLGPEPAIWRKAGDLPAFDRVLAMMERISADVIALQEVPLLRSQGVTRDVAEEMSRRLPGVFAASVFAEWPLDADQCDVDRYLMGNAILSRIRVHAMAGVHLPRPPLDGLIEPVNAPSADAGIPYRNRPPWYRLPRTALWARCETKGQPGAPVTFLTTHLTSRGSEQRRLEASEIAALVDAMSGPVILLGDFNGDARSTELDELTNRTREALSDVGVPPGDPRRWTCGDAQLDMVLLRGAAAESCRVLSDAEGISDHLPVVAKVRL